MKRRTFLGAVAALFGLPLGKATPDDDYGSFVIPEESNDPSNWIDVYDITTMQDWMECKRRFAARCDERIGPLEICTYPQLPPLGSYWARDMFWYFAMSKTITQTGKGCWEVLVEYQ